MLEERETEGNIRFVERMGRTFSSDAYRAHPETKPPARMADSTADQPVAAFSFLKLKCPQFVFRAGEFLVVLAGDDAPQIPSFHQKPMHEFVYEIQVADMYCKASSQKQVIRRAHTIGRLCKDGSLSWPRRG